MYCIKRSFGDRVVLSFLGESITLVNLKTSSIRLGIQCSDNVIITEETADEIIVSEDPKPEQKTVNKKPATMAVPRKFSFQQLREKSNGEK